MPEVTDDDIPGEGGVVTGKMYTPARTAPLNHHPHTLTGTNLPKKTPFVAQLLFPFALSHGGVHRFSCVFGEKRTLNVGTPMVSYI